MSTETLIGNCRCQGCGELVSYGRFDVSGLCTVRSHFRIPKRAEAHVSTFPAWRNAGGSAHECPAGVRFEPRVYGAGEWPEKLAVA